MDQLEENNEVNPKKRFGHTITMISKDRAIMFGGAVGDGVYKITNDTYSYDCRLNKWTFLKPKNSIEDSPSPRAAHGSTAVESNQLVIFGGAHSHGNLVDNALYLLKLSSNEAQGKWVRVPVEGQKPSPRYGHCMVFFKPYILVVGGNIGNEPCNDVWALTIERSPFFWQKLEFKDQPEARVYHSACIWKSKKKWDMVLIFGGRNRNNKALRDLWGLRRHTSGVWDWIQAPNKTQQMPTQRYQHSMICSENLAIVIGGRNNDSQNNLPMDIYNLEHSEWVSLAGINRFRHVSWLSYNILHTHGGFETKKPNVPTSLFTKLDLAEMFQNDENLLKNIELRNQMQVSERGQPSQGKKIKLNPDIVVAHFQNNNNGMMQIVNIDDLPQEPNKIIDYNQVQQNTNQQEDYIKNLYRAILKHVLKPFDFDMQTPLKFPIKPDIINVLCKKVKSVLAKTPSLIRLKPGVKIFGSLHGQYGDLMRFFRQYGVPDNDPTFEKKSDIEALEYLFLGNFIDRGKNSLEVICLLFALKLKFPSQIHLLRGSHEDIVINRNEGLYQECKERLGENPDAKGSVFNHVNEVFEYLSYGALIGERILCIHSGIGENVKTLAQIEKIRKPFTIKHNNLSSPDQKVVFDLLWSDPVLNVDHQDNQVNKNRKSKKIKFVRFGTNAIKTFLKTNKIKIIIRSHECVMEGAEAFGNTNLYTIFSCSGYGKAYENNAAIFHFHKHTKKLNTLTIPY